MAESILYGAVSNILALLASSAWQDLGSNFGWKNELEKLRGTLRTIHTIILDAEKKQESDNIVKEWISWLEGVVYDADDLVDEFDYEILRQKVLARRQVRNFFSSSNPLAYSLKMGPRIKDIRERLDAVAADMAMFNLRGRVVELEAKNTYRETGSKEESEIIGREEHKQSIIASLLQEQNDYHGSIVVIVGFGGLGKTSLAQLVFKDAKVEKFFDRRIWVNVHEEFDVCKIFNKILRSLGGSEVDELDLDLVRRQLEKVLKGLKYLLVLDDLWKEDIGWDNFTKYMVFGSPKSKILVTTRNKDVASNMGVKHPYILKSLNEDHSWALFEQVTFKGQPQIDTELTVIAKDITRRCKGVPLAIKSLGGLMRQKPKEYWFSVQENEIWKLFKEKDIVLSVLRLSYIHLPRHLKQCFSFCSIFPKDFKMSKDLLIKSWRAQGYIQGMGEKDFNELLSKSFFQEEEKDDYGNIISCQMHGLIHDLALSVAESSFYLMKDEHAEVPRGVRHVLLEKFSKEVVLALSKTKGIRTINFRYEFIGDLFLLNVIFKSFNCLRMLNLSCMNIDIVPNSISKLKHLRYLDLSGNGRLAVLPNAVTKLHTLQTLLLYSCKSLKELPRDTWQLISLEYLGIDGCDDLKCLPKGLGKLTSLQRLQRFIVNSVKKGFSGAATLNELRDLNDLGNYLSIENLDMVRNVELESMETNLKGKKRLQSLQLGWKDSASRDYRKDELLLDNLQPHHYLKELSVYGYEGAKFSRWLSYLKNLVKIHIYKSWNFQHVVTLPPLDELSSLQSITLEDLALLEHVADGMGDHPSFPSHCFQSLQQLEIRNCPKLNGWWRTRNENQGSTAELPWFPCLSKLKIINCPKLTSMPLFPSVDQELSLEHTSIRPLRQTLKMKITKSCVTSEASSSGSTCSTAFPLSNLKCLTLAAVNDVNDLEALSEEFLQNLTFLTCLTFKDCDKLELLLPQKMNCLTSLQELWVENCSNLRALLDWIPRLTSLHTLTISKDSDLQHLPEGMRRLTSLRELWVVECSNLRSFPDWILDLTSLTTLKIWDCRKFQSLPDGMNRLTSLKHLSIKKCPQFLERRAKEIGIWPDPACIPSIEIDELWIQ